MKQEILKIAGVKDEKSFYKKFPSEEAFMKIHGKEFKKAKMGTAMVKKQLIQLTDFANPPQAQDGWHSEWNDEPIYNEREISISNTSPEQKPKAPSYKPATKANVNVSVVDFMNSKGMKSDFNTRKSLAQQYGIKDYKGTAEQNMQLMSNLKGKTSAPKKAEAPKKVEAAASNKPAPVKPKLSKAEEWIAKDPYFFAEESDPEWIKTIDAPFTGIRNLGARTVFDRDPKAFAKLLAMGALGGLGKMIINKTEELYPYNPKQIGGPAPKQISNYAPTPKQIGGRPQPTGWSTESGMRSGQYPIKEDGGYVPQAQGGWHSGWDQNLYDEYTNPVSAEDEYIANMDAMNVAQSPMKQFPINIAGSTAKTPLESKDNIFGGVRNIIQGGIQMKDDRQKYLRAKQWGKIADISQKGRKDDVAKNRYNFPWDVPTDPDQLSRSRGTGYGILGSAQDGMQIGGNETPIHNMYTNGDTLYSDLGYEPLEESVKQYENGGGLFDNWQSNLTKFGSQNATTLGGSAGSFIGGGDGRTSGTSTMLGGVGQLAGTAIGGPLGGVIGSLAGSALGGLFSAGQEKRMEEQQNKISTLGGMQNIYNFQGRNSGFMEDGGEVGLKYLSHDWQPQVITKFGDYDVKDLLKDDPTMDTLRYGGTMRHPKNPTQRALQTYDMGGELEVDDRGDIDYEGYNPITAASGANGYIGITRGPSHDNGGFNLSYGGNKIEAEGNETIMEKADDGASINPETGQPESNLIILGDMKTLDNGQFIGQNANKETLKKVTKGKNIKDMKFKHAGNNIAKLTGSLNKKEDRYLEMLDDNDPLKNASATAALKGIDMQYQDLHNIQNNLINLQESYHSAAKQNGYDDTPEFLKDLKNNSLSGNMARFGAKMETAESGNTVASGDDDLKAMYEKAKVQGRGKAVTDFQKAFHARYPELAKSIIGEEKYGTTSYGKSRNLTKADLASNEDSIFGPRTERYMASISGSKRVPGPVVGGNKTAPTPPNITATVPDMPTVQPVAPKDKMGLNDIYGTFSQYLKPYIKNPLDPRQLADVLSRDRSLQGVRAQGFQPYLETPYSVSFQDQMNANQADFNAMQRQLGGDPSALATLAAQKYAANSGVLGQQFRANQEMQMGAYNRNRAALNDAAVRHLAIYDVQGDKASRAKSIRDAQLSADLSSTSDKIMRAKAEELAANVQANMFPDYTFGPKGRIYNTGIANFDIPQNISSDPEFAKMYSDYLNKKDTKTKDTKVKNGGIVKAYKNL